MSQEMIIQIFSLLIASIPAIGLIYVGGTRLIKDIAKQTAAIARMEEITRLNNITLEGLKIIDTETANKLLIVQQKVSDLEEYLVLMTEITEDTRPLHPFKIRSNATR